MATSGIETVSERRRKGQRRREDDNGGSELSAGNQRTDPVPGLALALGAGAS